jgi:acetylornithine deacetylase/succinyl-diaminopimelate desuccinylase-like protein
LEPPKTPIDGPVVKAAISAAKEVSRSEPVVYPNAARSSPDYLFTKLMGLHPIWTGCTSSFSNAHAPNEFETLDDLFKGIELAGPIMENFARYNA